MEQRTSSQEQQRRAIRRALANGGASTVTRLRYGLYTVESATRPGLTHRVSVEGGVYRCSCEAGLAGRPCWHAGAVLVAETEHASGCRVTGPAAPVVVDEAPTPIASNVVALQAA
jgi:hypothetical protein